MQVENTSAPIGDTQTLDPRPRPATWSVATAVKPLGRRCRSSKFLIISVRYNLGFNTRGGYTCPA